MNDISFLKPHSPHQILPEGPDRHKIKNLTNLAKNPHFDIQYIRNIKNEKEKLKVVAAEFESILLKMMFKSMKSTLINSKPLIHGGYAEKVFDDMLLTERSRTVAHHQSLGVAKMIYQQHVKYLN